jgi:hypothetical protein
MQLRSCLAVSLLCTSAIAQVDFDFRTDDAASDFTWSGTSNYGNVVGNPSNAFEFHGHFGWNLAPSGSDPIASGAFVPTGDLHVVPDLHGKIPNPFPFLPPLATIDVVDCHMVMSSSSFAIASNGSFTTAITFTITMGTMDIQQLGGTSASLDLTGFNSDPDVHTGSLTQVGQNLHVVLPISTTFPFDFSSQGGATGTIDIVGTLVADWVQPAPQVYCTAKTNSLGCVPSVSTSGTPSTTLATPFVVTATNELNQKNGLMYYGYAQLAAPFQGGTKCVAPPTLRTPTMNSGGSASGSDCTGVYAVDFNAWTQSGIDPMLVPGREVFCQFWSRDPQSFANTNLSDAARFLLAP